jgi:hypothetical protein
MLNFIVDFMAGEIRFVCVKCEVTADVENVQDGFEISCCSCKTKKIYIEKE